MPGVDNKNNKVTSIANGPTFGLVFSVRACVRVCVYVL